MAQYNSEYSGPAVAGSGCSYAKLGCYYGGNGTMAPARPTAGIYVTPNYASIGYDALTHGASGSCNRYFSITDAYGKNAGNCNTTFTQRMCGAGQCGKPVPPPQPTPSPYGPKNQYF